MTTSRHTNHAAVLLAVQARLLSQIKSLTPSTCFLTLEPEPSMEIKSNVFMTICPMGGQFEDGFMEGAGQHGALERTGVIVTIWSNIKLDKAGEAGAALTDATRGVLSFKRDVLLALASHDLLDSSGRALLAEYMMPVSCEMPRASVYDDSKGGKVGIPLAFSTAFLWDLAD